MSAPLVEPGLASALAMLGLRPDTDARAVRRAYAQQLKQIDQATELQAFQALRQAYEQALDGLARRDAQAAQAPQAAPSTDDVTPGHTVAPTAPARPEAPPAAAAPLPDSAELAQAVFKPFAARAAAGFQDEADASDALQHALADERLLNIEARTIFEWQVAQLLMNGWRPGHEFLFGPACAVFDWDKDRAHLRIFGQLGAVLDAAISEKLMFFQQTSTAFELQRSAIRRLRQTEMPSLALRRADLPLVQMLVQRYPNWLRMVTSQANINSWFVGLPDEPPSSDAKAGLALSAPMAAPVPSPRIGWKIPFKYQLWFAVVWLIVLLLKFMQPSEPVQPWQQPAAATATQRRVPSDAPTVNWPPNSLLGPPETPYDMGKSEPRPLYEGQLPVKPPLRDLYGLPTPPALLATPQRHSAARARSASSVDEPAMNTAPQSATTRAHAASAPGQPARTQP